MGNSTGMKINNVEVVDAKNTRIILMKLYKRK